MNEGRPKLRVFLDEGVPLEVGHTFEAHGHNFVIFDEVIKRGSPDVLVCAVAQANEAILVAFDNDMRQVARRYGVGSERFKKLNLIKFDCPEPMAAKRLEHAMSFVEHEWSVSIQKVARRLHVEIGTHVLRSFR